jgi:dienelactone hydrolase
LYQKEKKFYNLKDRRIPGVYFLLSRTTFFNQATVYFRVFAVKKNKSMKRFTSYTLITFLLLCSSFICSNAQQVFKTTSTSVIGYLEYTPQDYNTTSSKYPVMIFLHGKGERGANSTDPAVLATTINAVTKLGPPSYVKNGTQFPFILISPQLKNNYGTWPVSYVMEVINHVKTYMKIDEKRIYLTGLSLGGGGVWMTAQDYSALFAAIAPVCGGYNTLSKACNIAGENLPVWAFHGDQDSIVPMSRTINMVNAINNCTPKPSPLAKVTIYPGVGHSAWTNAYKTDNSVHNPNLYQWMLSYTNTKNKGNDIPQANAGVDQTKTLASTLTLTGSGSDLDGSITSYSWKQLGGPSMATLTNATSATVSLSNVKVGVYLMALQVKDNAGNTDTDYVKLTVSQSNILPTVNAGTDKTITLPTSSVTMTGTASDTDGTIASYAWTKVSGGAVALSGTTTASLSASALLAGSYVFRLTVTDNLGGKKSDDVAVTVLNATATNVAPVASAGTDKILMLPTNYTTLFGSATDTDGTIASYHWTKTKGGPTYYTGQYKPALSVSNLVAGSYSFRLTVTDNQGATSYDEVIVTVKSSTTTTTTSSTSSTSSTIVSGELDTMLAVNDDGINDDHNAILGDLTSNDLENSTVVLFSDSGEQLYSGSWTQEKSSEVMTRKGLYIYNVIRKGRRVEAGKVYIR